MIGFVPTEKTLHLQKIWFRNEPVEGTSIYPLFDKNTQVKQLMVILPGIDDIYIVPWNPGLVNFGFWGTRRLMLSLGELRTHNCFNSASFRALHHYDPWWILDKRRFWRYRDFEQLRQTNCANKFTQRIMTACFNSDLSKLNKFKIDDGSLNLSYPSARFDEMTWRSGSGLNSRNNWQQTDNSFTSQWHLDPVWNDWVQ